MFEFAFRIEKNKIIRENIKYVKKADEINTWKFKSDKPFFENTLNNMIAGGLCETCFLDNQPFLYNEFKSSNKKIKDFV